MCKMCIVFIDKWTKHVHLPSFVVEKGFFDCVSFWIFSNSVSAAIVCHAVFANTILQSQRHKAHSHRPFLLSYGIVIPFLLNDEQWWHPRPSMTFLHLEMQHMHVMSCLGKFGFLGSVGIFNLVLLLTPFLQ